MGFLNTDSMPKLVEALADANNIKITGNTKGTKVGTVVNKIVEKADEVTKAVEQEVSNTTHSFKVGAGNVDVSSDVQDGFGEVGIKGVTYQNLLGKYFIGSGSNDYISIESEKIKFNKPQIGSNISIRYPDAPVQPSKTYTLMFYVYKNTLQREDDSLVNVAKFNIVSYNTGFCNIPKNTTGLIKAVLHQPSIATGDGKPYLEVYGSCFGELEVSYPILLEGDHTNTPNLPQYFEGIVGVGDKSKNLFNEILVNNNSYKDTGISENGSYNISFDIETTKRLGLEAMQGSNQLFNVAIQSGKISKNITLSNGESLKLRLYRWDSGSELISMSNMMIEKGVIATEFEDSYDGYKIEILSCGKNTINLNDMPLGNLENSGQVVMSPTSGYKIAPNFIKIEPSRKFCFYYEYNENDTSTPNYNMIAYYDKNFSFIRAVYDILPKGIVITPPAEAHYLRLRVRKEAIKLSLIFESSIIYEPYQEDKTQILLDEPLMSLPDGLCDEITRDGKLIRRVGKVVLDGTQGMFKSTVMSSDGSYRYGYRATDGAIKSSTNLICDKLVVKTPQTHNSIFQTAIDDYTCCGLYLATKDYSEVVDYKQWLSQNPVTVYYELKTPVITDIAPSTLRIFKDGHITFNTLVAPESTHLVQLNKSAQIERSIREVQGLDARVERLEGFYDDMILETAHKLSTLDFDFSLIRKGE